MAIVVGRNEVGVKRVGQVVSIPDHDVARLMYYLSCVCNAIDCNQDEDIRRFTNYAYWFRLSAEEQRLLVLLCYTFSPDNFEGKVFFHSEELCVDCGNEFYEIRQIRDRLVAVESIIIAGRTHHVSQIMTYKMHWMQRNYIEPMQRLARQFAAAQASERQPLRSLPSSSSSDDGCCCIIL